MSRVRLVQAEQTLATMISNMRSLFGAGRRGGQSQVEALFGDQAQQVVHPDHQGDQAPDDRTVVTNITVKPWRPLSCLSLVFADVGGDRDIVGSGILVAPSVILTAAHNLYSLRTRAFTKSAYAHVGTHNGQHSATARIKRVEICPGYSDFAPDDIQRYRYDFGIAKVESNALMEWSGEFLDVANQAPLPDDELARSVLNVAGYPVEAGPTKLKFHFGQPLRDTISPTNFRYRMDTTEGQSGGPVFRYVAATQQVAYAGVHVGGDARGNIARRYNAGMQNRLREWFASLAA